VYVDSCETTYVADYSKHRLMKWNKGDKEGIPISVGDHQAKDFDQVYYPWAISSDQQGHLFVTDHFFLVIDYNDFLYNKMTKKFLYLFFDNRLKQ
jgi:hypothetical protein